jgi:hypothetical protein
MGRTIVIVGNGEIAEGLAPTIDAAELVVRFNDCRSVGRGGERTDIVAVCNTGRPGKAMIDNSGWPGNRAVWLANAIWCVRDPAKFRAMRDGLLSSHPELDDFCDDYTDGFANYARANGKDFRIVPGATHEALDRALSAFDPLPYVVPSSGAVVISEILTHFRQPDDRVLIAGFGHQGWDGHPWAAEKAWVEDLVRRSVLSRLNAASNDTPFLASGK